MTQSAKTESRLIVPAPHLTFFRGRYALRAILQAIGVGEGKSVALQAFTCYAVPLPVLTLGARPIYVDCEPRSLCMDPQDLESKIDSTTAAIVVQHTFGIPASLDRIIGLAAERGIPVVEDCCHGSASSFGDRGIGEFGVASFYSYEWGKPLVAGVGGGVRVNDEALLTIMESLHQKLGPPGRKQRLLLGAQFLAFAKLLPRVGYWRLRRFYRRLSKLGLIVGTFQRQDFTVEDGPEAKWTMGQAEARRLQHLVAGARNVTAHHLQIQSALTGELVAAGLPTWTSSTQSDAVLLRYPLRTSNKRALIRDAQNAGVELSDIFSTPIHPLPPSEWRAVGYREGECPVAERLSREVVSIPVGSRVRVVDVERTVEFLSRHRADLFSIRHGRAVDDGEVRR
jgi:perosamine synthetase